jgi:hypothetical protein
VDQAPIEPGFLVVKRVRLAGPIPTEGSVSFVTVTTVDGVVLRGLLGPADGFPTADLTAGKRLVRLVAAGPFTISHEERPCVASCGALDEPLERCDARHEMPSGRTIVATIALSVDGCGFRFSEARPLTPRADDPSVSARPGVGYGFSIFAHCGIGHPVEFDGRFWIPQRDRYAGGLNAPEGFGFNTDLGEMTLIDVDTAVYVSSGGTTVRYEPFQGSVEPFICY